MKPLTKKLIAGAVIVGAAFVAASKPQKPARVTDAIGIDEPVLQGEESLFAEVDAEGTVLRVIVADKEVIRSGVFGDPKNWVRTFANGRGRGSYAGRGYTYRTGTDEFIPPTPAPTPR